ncbi:MAG: hypothetical protein V4850_17175 [Myxococcota bacterium]
MSEPVRPPRGGVVLVSTEGAHEPFVAMLEAAGFVVVVAELGFDPTDPEVIRIVTTARDRLPPGARFVVGLGGGGLYARLAACAVLGLAGAVGFGGRISYSGVNLRQPIQPMDLLPGLSCPLQCHFRADDPAAPAAHVDELERRLAGACQPWQVFRYTACTEADTRTAWGRACSFLMHLAAERA